MATGGDDFESPAERQENELQLIEAIYMHDVKDLRNNDPWKIDRPPELQITLGPQESINTSQAHVHVDLIIKCPSTYPDSVPCLRFDNAKGLSDGQLVVLKEELDALARSLVGEVMMLDLCQHVQKYLHSHNKPPSRSFYDEMITNKRLLDEKLARDAEKKQQMLRQHQVQLIDDEIEKRHEALREDVRLRKELAKQTIDTHLTLSDHGTPSSDLFPGSTPIHAEPDQQERITDSPSRRTQVSVADSGAHHHKQQRRRRTSTPLSGDSDNNEYGDTGQKTGVVMVTFNTKTERKVHMGKCLGHSPRGSSVYAGMDVRTGELVAISEWVLKWRHINRKLNLDERETDEKEANKYIKQVAAIEKEMFSLLRLNHKHLIHYQAIKHIQEHGRITIYVLMDYAGGGNLSWYIKRNDHVPMNLIRQYTTQALEALVYLHSNAIIHKDIRASSLMFDQDGKLRLADVSLTKRLTDLVAQVNSTTFVDESSPVIGGRGGKKGDIYKLGLLLLSLAKGELVMETIPEIPPSLPHDLRDLLNKCLSKDEFHRWSAYQLSEHSFVKTPLYTQPINMDRNQIHNRNRQGENANEDSSEESIIIPYIPASHSGSRLQNEFEILKWLGKGGFGDVIKVKNKLDGRFYAIKRIPLNPSKKSFTRKITREVKLLSMLNHENVVRYYNSWIETSSEPISNNSSSTCTSPMSRPSQSPPNKTQTHRQSHNKPRRADVLSSSVGYTGDLDMPEVMDSSVEWSVSVDIIRISDEESSQDEDDVFGVSFLPHSDSEDDGIIFEHDENSDSDSDSEIATAPVVKEKYDDEAECGTSPRIQFLYIQMEFCDKSTLRNCIDGGLYEDIDRVWQLLREIVEGLVHIHKQGMIHRDLKPVNIFLDSNDQVKIGDFGLATTDIISKQQTPLVGCSSSHSESLEERDDLTGKVGTALYVAPEMITTKRVHYSQKVDIYSLGVMFFEMCHPPLPTGMERVKILSSIREPHIKFPDDFNEDVLTNQVQLLQLMLTHDPSKRPTASEILQSELLPPPEMEEAELSEVLRSTMSNRDSKLYKRMTKALFSQPVTPAIDFAYDSELYKTFGQFSPDLAKSMCHVMETLDKIFKKHGAIHVSTPMLMPKCKLYENNESYVCLMDQKGGLVALPYDLKVPFARFVARHGIHDLKRFTVEKVFRENRILGLQPKELVACSFDIVTSTSASFLPDAEVISVVFEMIAEFPALQNRNYFLRINHKLLLEGILVYCGVPSELHQEVCSILGDTKNEKQRKTQIQTRLYSLSLSEHTVNTLYSFVEKEGPYGQVASMLRRITKTKGIASSLALKGLKEMEAIINHTEALGVKVQTVITLGLVSNIVHYSGAIFQVVRNVRKKTRQMTEVLASGGRYDGLLTQFRKPGSMLSQCVVGISVALERVVAATTDHKFPLTAPLQDVVVCSLGAQAFIKEKLAVTKELWTAGVSTTILYDTTQSQEEIQDYCRKCGISHIVILKEPDGPVFVRVRSLEKDKVQEKKIKLSDVTVYLQQKLQISTQETSDTTQSQSSKSSLITSQMSSEGGVTKETGSSNSLRHKCNISIINMDNNNKTAKNTRRNYEAQIYSNVSSCLVNISTKSQIEILAVDLASLVLKTIAAHLDLNETEKTFCNSIGPIIERHTRYKKYLTKIFDHIAEAKFEKNIPVIVLYGLKDDCYKVLL